jgi:hypothetical protein
VTTYTTNLTKRLKSRYGVTLLAASDGYTVAAPGYLLHCGELCDLMKHLAERQTKTKQRPSPDRFKTDTPLSTI